MSNPSTPAAKPLPEGALRSAVSGATMLDAWAETDSGRNFLAHALVQLDRDGWLRHNRHQDPGPGTGTLQVLWLPDERIGEATRPPFALVLSDVVNEPDSDETAQWNRFKEQVGAKALLITRRKVDVA